MKRRLAKHCTEDDAWMALGGRVYDVTSYVEVHPRGRQQVKGGTRRGGGGMPR